MQPRDVYFKRLVQLLAGRLTCLPVVDRFQSSRKRRGTQTHNPQTRIFTPG